MTCKRDHSLDSLCGLFIIQMIVQHAFQWANACNDTFYLLLGDVLYCFMAWFFFKSGMYYKKRPVMKTLKHDFRKLMIPYVIYSILGQLLYSWNHYITTGDTNWIHYLLTPLKWAFITGSFTGNLPLWFLLSLFVVKGVVVVADKYNLSKIMLLLVALIVSGGGTLLQLHTTHVIYWIFSSALGMVFYIAGFYLRNMQYHSKWVKIAGALCFCVSIFMFPSMVNIHMDTTVKGYWMVYVMGSIGSIIVLNNLFRLHVFQLPLLQSIGRNSMDYYCAHWILFYIVILIFDFPQDGSTNYTLLWILIISSAIILPTYSYLLKAGKNNIKINTMYEEK